MKYAIWGAGVRGKRIYYHLEKADVAAFIDNDEKKHGTEYCEKPVINLTQYQEKYSECYIIVSNLREKEVVDKLKQNNINRYFLLSECPGEFQEPFPKNLLKEYVCNYVERDRTYAIYGCNLYAVELCRWIERKLGKRINIIPHRDVQEKIFHNLKKDFLEDRYIELKEYTENKCDEVLVTVEQDMDYLKEYLYKKIILTNIYDCSDKIMEYYNPRLERYKNFYKNRRCFIIGTGPSLRMDDLDTLYNNNEVCFSMNNIFRCFDNTKWRPQYYVVTDYEFIKDGQILLNVPEPTKLISDCCQLFWERNQDDSILKFHTQYEMFQGKRPKFSSNFAQKSYLGATVAFACLQLAVYMGFTEIYLLGIDCSYLKNSSENYFYIQDTKDSLEHGTDYMVMAYQSAKDYADAHDIKIFNATRGGELEVFKRMEFDRLFDKNDY